MSELSPLKTTFMSLYYHGMRPYRWWNRQRASAAGSGVPMPVVFYHRVADDVASSWTVSNRIFIRQIDWLKKHFELISLSEAQRRIRNRLSGPPAVAITFDDGYSENCHRAIPYLIENKIPCTYFVTLGNVLDGAAFDHDIVAGIDAPPNTMDQLREMAATGIEIGAHCRNHIDLGGICDQRALYDEIVAPRAVLEKELKTSVRYFAFPFAQYMNLNSDAFSLAAKAGYEGIVSGYGGYNWPATDPFHIERIGISNSMIRMKHHVTVDPRNANPPRFRCANEILDRETVEMRSTAGVS
ncbi:MAG: polysaccharide deacetylase family protein [Pirellulales bacterium]|nr:polysaccharide deacetylase family protein [Pirellulales bacterium]